MNRLIGFFVLLAVIATSASLANAEGPNLLLAWGSSDNGLLVVEPAGATVVNPVVIPVSYFDGESVVSVASGADFAVAATDSGKVWTWGSNAKGQLGNTSYSSASSVPVRVQGLGPEYGEIVVQVSATQQTAVAITGNGFIWTWGSNTRGALGNGTKVYAEGTIAKTPVWALLPTGAGKPVSVGCGKSAFCVVLTDSHKVFTWGSNEDSALGYNTGFISYVTIPAAINSSALTGNDYIASVSVGGRHVIALTHERRVLIWGSNVDGQLGTGVSGVASNSFLPSPFNLTRLGANAVVTQVTAGGSHSLVLTGSNLIYGWGLCQTLQLGAAMTDGGIRQLTPIPFSDQSSIWGDVLQVVGFGDSSFATSSRARFYGWGYAGDYVLGSNWTVPSFGPLKVHLDALPAGYFIAQFPNSGFATTAFAIANSEALPPSATTNPPSSAPPGTPLPPSGVFVPPADREPPPFSPPVQPPVPVPAFSGRVPSKTPGNSASYSSPSSLFFIALLAVLSIAALL